MKYIFPIIIILLIGNTIHADANIRLRGVAGINELGDYEYGGNKAEKMESNLYGTYLFIYNYGLGFSKTINNIGIDRSNTDSVKQLNDYELTSNWIELYFLLHLTKTTTFSFGLGKLSSGSGNLKTYESIEYNSNDMSGSNLSMMIGFEYNPFFAPKDSLELLFGVKQNYIKYDNFKNARSSPSNSSIDFKSFQLFWGLGIVF